jgi:polygalacturonase
MTLMGSVLCSICLQDVHAQPDMKFPSVKLPAFRKDTIHIKRFGARPDGLFLNTQAITAAINECHRKGGGVVVVPSGLWLTGPLTLKSRVNLHLTAGATLLFTADFSQYPLVVSSWEGLPQMRNQSPISATDAEDIAITGKGIIDGNGDKWRMVKKEKLSESNWEKLLLSGGLLNKDSNIWYPTESSLKGAAFTNPGVITPDKDAAFYASVKDFLRPNLVVLTRCKRILLDGVTFQHSAAWGLHPLMSTDITVRNISVKNPWYAQNGDGIDVESCRNVIIEHSVFDVGDDALCMKSGRDEEGRKRAMPTENVRIRNCTVYASHGGFVIGSEMSGGVRNIDVSNCTFIGTDIGLRFKTTRGRGGIVEDIRISDITMIGIPGEAILFDMYYAARDPVALAGEVRQAPSTERRPVDATTPVFRNFSIRNVRVIGSAKGIFIRGLPEMLVTGIDLENITIQSDVGVEIQDAAGLRFANVNVQTKYSNPVVNIINASGILFDRFSYRHGSELLFSVFGERSGKISIINTDGSKAVEKLRLGAGTNPYTVGW